MFIIFIPCTATSIDIRKEGTIHHGGPRMPSITKVAADYENDVITIEVEGYTGGFQVFVSDVQDNVVCYTMSSIVNSGTITLDIGALAEGSYSLNIVLGNDAYWGQFYKD